MTDMHVSTVQMSSAVQSSGSNSPAIPSAAAFATLLSGQLGSSPATISPAEATYLPDAEIVSTANSSARLRSTARSDPTPDENTSQAHGHPGLDAATQLLVAIGVLPPADMAKSLSVQEAPTEHEVVSATATLPAALTAKDGKLQLQGAPTRESAADPAKPAISSATGTQAGEPPKTPHGVERADPPAATPAGTLPEATTLDKPHLGEPGFREIASLLATSVPPSHAQSAAELPVAATQSFTSATLSAPSAPHQMSVPGSVGSVLWRDEFVSSVSLLASQHASSAELRVEPAELGPILVSIRIEASEAHITCAAQHADTRQALEAALPRLREMLEANGIAVGDASVGPQTSDSGFSKSRSDDQVRRSGLANPVPDDEAALAADSQSRASQLVDIFA